MKVENTTVEERESIIRRSPIFSSQAGSELAALAEVAVVQRYAGGEFLFQQEEPADGFHILAGGCVQVQRVGVDGREQVLHVFDGGGEPIGEVPVFEGGCFPASAVAVGGARTLYITRDAFIQAARLYPEILLKMLATLSVRLRRFVGLIDDLSLKDVSARVARHILDLSLKSESATVELETTKAVLASRLGTIAETLSRTLRKMQNRGIILVDGRVIEILDEDALDDVAAGEKL